MKKLYDRTFEIVPVAQGRPRVYRMGGGVRAVDPQKSREFKAALGMMAMADRVIEDIPLEVELVFYIPVPSSWGKKRKQQALDGKIMPTSRPDIDNYTKAVLDALNGIVWGDDSQVVRITATKTYGTPGVHIKVYEYEMPIY